jgi:polypeptide N-acetylgalactosaminyltransferase
MCGGSLVHIPCSKLGHIARVQPYSFPGGRRKIEVHNYKRAVELWMEDNHKSFIYDYFPDMPVMSDHINNTASSEYNHII